MTTDETNEESGEATGRRLKAYVLVHEPVTLTPHTFGPDDEVPDWAIPLIRRDDVWEGEEPESDSPAPADGMWGMIAAVPTMVVEDFTRSELIDFAERLGLEVGVHFNKSADKMVIFAAIKHRAEEIETGQV